MHTQPLNGNFKPGIHLTVHTYITYPLSTFIKSIQPSMIPSSDFTAKYLCRYLATVEIISIFSLFFVRRLSWDLTVGVRNDILAVRRCG